MLNSTVLMSSPRHFDTEWAINPYYTGGAPDAQTTQEEHTRIRRTLTEIGIEVISVDAPEDSQDGVYTANWALVHRGVAVLASLPHTRRSEEAHAARLLKEMGLKVVSVPEGSRFSGQGDALICGSLAFCGQGYRSDPQAQEFACDLLGLKRIQLKTLPQLCPKGEPMLNSVTGWADSFFYDIDLALSIIREPSASQPGLIAYCPEAFEDHSRRTLESLQHQEELEFIEVSEKEAREHFACNLISTGSDVVMSAHAPRLKAELESRGVRVHTPLISELAKGGGYIRCTTLSITR